MNNENQSNMMYCKKCGNQISKEAYACPKCGVLTNGKPTAAKGQKSKISPWIIALIATPIVLVVLSIIALITVPIILNGVSEGQRRATKDSARGYAAAVEFEIAKSLLYGDDTYANGIYTNADLEVKGMSPESVSLMVSDGVVTYGTMVFESYLVTYEDGEVTSIEYIND